MTDIKNVMRSLIDQLLKWDHAYYIQNQSLVSNDVYDSVYQKLEGLEKQHPDCIFPDSPTQRVSGGTSE